MLDIGGIVDQLKSEGYSLEAEVSQDGTITAVFPEGTSNQTKQAIRNRMQAIKTYFEPPAEAEVRAWLDARTNAQILALTKELLVPLLMKRPAIWRSIPN